MMLFRKLAFFTVFLVSFSSLSHADALAISEKLNKSMSGLSIKSIAESEMPGMFRVTGESDIVFYTNADASFFFVGELFSLKANQPVNLTEAYKTDLRKAQIASVHNEQKIVFPATGEKKASVTVFTDIDCGYCRKLHQEVPKLNAMGIEVSYVGFPRAGVGSESYNKLVSSFCSKDPLKALTDAKAGIAIPAAVCDNPVADQYLLGQKIGIRGTPAIVLDDGTLIPGYLSAEQLRKRLGV